MSSKQPAVAPPSADTPAAEARTGDLIRLTALAAVTALLVFLCFVLAVPFLPAITWGVALAIMAFPMHRLILRYVQRPTVAAAISTAIVVVVLLGPGLFVAYHLAREAAGLAAWASQRSSEQAIEETLTAVPGLRPVVDWMKQAGLDINAEVRRVVGWLAAGAADIAQGSATAAVQFLLAIFILFYVFQDRGMFVDGLRSFLPLSSAESNRVMSRARDSVHANLYANVVTSLISTGTGGLVFWAVGLPAPILWAAVMFVLSLLPILGSGMVWIPAVIYLLTIGKWGAATAIVVWGILTAIFIDNILLVRLAGGRMRMHEVPTLIAFLGGVAVFGVSGMVLGPVILAVTLAVLEVWKTRIRGDAPVA
jgi:predicted PurR-regulated permease PerM